MLNLVVRRSVKTSGQSSANTSTNNATYSIQICRLQPHRDPITVPTYPPYLPLLLWVHVYPTSLPSPYPVIGLFSFLSSFSFSFYLISNEAGAAGQRGHNTAAVPSPCAHVLLPSFLSFVLFFFHLISDSVGERQPQDCRRLPLHALWPSTPTSRHSARYRVDRIAHATTHRPRRAQPPPPHCRTNQHHRRYRPSHCHIINTVRKSEPGCPLHPLTGRCCSFTNHLEPAANAHKTSPMARDPKKMSRISTLKAHNALTLMSRLRSCPGTHHQCRPATVMTATKWQ
jgi:hypothetical protein